MTVDGVALDTAHLERLRQETAWVDPEVQIWNRSLLDNLRYGLGLEVPNLGLLEQAELHDLLKKLPTGLQTELGENGALVSGGEGQRVAAVGRLSRSHERCKTAADRCVGGSTGREGRG